jgi:GntR family transcriptional regulator, transcriptional repressor for pyruvate dehydrogenase complex
MTFEAAFTSGPDGFRRGGRRRNLKTSERIARDIAAYIVDAHLPEGARLPREKEMLDMLGVGRMTLREALRLLDTQGVIDIRSGPHGGPVVRRPQPEDLAGSLTLLLQFHAASLADVMLARQALEPMVARLAAEHVTDEQLEALGETVDLMRRHAGSQDVFHRENERFHQLVAVAAGSVTLRVFSDTLKTIASGEEVGIEYGPDHHVAVAKAHDRILSALRRRRPRDAEKAMADHLAEAATYWQRRYPELWARPVRWVQS